MANEAEGVTEQMPPSAKKRYRGETGRKGENERVSDGRKCMQHIPSSCTDESSVRADVSMIKQLRQPRCCLADIFAVAKTCLFDYNGRVDYVY